MGQQVHVEMLSIDIAKNRTSLRMKRCVDNAWPVFVNKYTFGSIVSGVKNNTG